MPDVTEDTSLEIERAAKGGLLAGNKAIAGLLGMVIVLLLVAVTAATLTMLQVREDTQQVEHTLLVETSINRLAAYNEQVETGRRGYILDPSQSFQVTVENAATAVGSELVTLEGLVSDNPDQQQRLARISQLDDERNGLLKAMFSGRIRPGLEAGTAFETDRGVAIVRTIRSIAAQMAETEAALLKDRNQSQLDSLVRLYTIGGAALVLLIGALAAVILIVVRYNRKLDEAQGLLMIANEGLESAIVRRTAELQRANQEIQRFAYIVSHDLRSPLVNVLGFTSELDAARKTIHEHISTLYERHPALKDEQVWLAVEEDLPEALGFIRTSTEKMDRLINSILQLSRQGRRQLTPEVLDMNEIASGVLDTMYQRAADAGASMSAGALPPVESDRMAVEQILSNLVENAIKYLSPKRAGEIRIEGRKAGRMVEIDVVDNGRGISRDDHERIFELFRRSGTQDTAGEGIGLAHVRALAYRLGGLVEVESELDHGSRFRLTLPARFTAPETDT